VETAGGAGDFSFEIRREEETLEDFYLSLMKKNETTG